MLKEGQEHDLPALVIGLGSEPLLFKGAKEVMSSAIDANIMDMFLGTNGVLLTEDVANFLVDNEIARIEISLDAATPETYTKVRGKNELARIEANIRQLLDIKRQRNAKLPVVRLTFCVQEINSHERGDFLNKWKDLVDYVDFQLMIDHGDIDELRETGTLSDINEVIVEKSHCAYPFNSLHVWANGNITPCCTFFAKSEELVLGNAEDMTLQEAWTGEKLASLREEILSGNLNDICKVCLGKRSHDTFNEVSAANQEEG